MRKNLLFVFLTCIALGFAACDDDDNNNGGNDDGNGNSNVEIAISDIDLWQNTAKVTLTNATADDTVQYREKDASAWQNAIANEDGTFTIAPVWEEGKNSVDSTIYTPVEGTGVWADKTYEYRVVNAGKEIVAPATFETDAGDVIPNGDMSAWSTKDGSLPYPNAEGESFWDSGNNSMSALFGVTLCQQDTTDAGVAYLSSGMVLGVVFAPGNMFTGDFTMDGTLGTVSFGKAYEWTARPKALKVRFKAEVGKIDKVGTYDEEGKDLKGQQDKIPVFAAVVDWSKQHGVTSGMGEPSGMWHPAQTNKLDEGAILGYASHYVEESLDDYAEIEIPFEWYDNAAKPSNEFTLVISCATSYRGDYLTGCSTNKLWIDSFEWVY